MRPTRCNWAHAGLARRPRREPGAQAKRRGIAAPDSAAIAEALGLDAGGHRGDRGRVVEQRLQRNMNAEIGRHPVEQLYATQRVAAQIEEVIQDSDAGLQQPLP
jgi:hypothetical protein